MAFDLSRRGLLLATLPLVLAARPAFAGRTFSVGTSSQLASALSEAQAGDTILLANGTYSGSFQPARSGIAGAPITIRAANRLGAVLTGTLSLSGRSHIWVFGLDVRSSRAFQVAGDHNRIEACRITGSSAIKLTSGASYNAIGYNQFSGTSSGPDILLELTQGQINVGKTAKGNRIFRNHFVATPSASSYACIYIGEQKLTNYPDTGTVIEYNFFDRILRNSVLRLKANGCTVRYNSVVNNGEKSQAGCARMDNRNGNRNLFLANYLQGNRGMVIHDSDNKVFGNVLSGKFTNLDIMAGVTANSADAAHPPCVRGQFDGNSGKVRVGWEYYNAGTILRAENNAIRAHRTVADVKLYTWQRATQFYTSSANAVGQAFLLSAGQVGPGAWTGA
jgi:hypothetical protein